MPTLPYVEGGSSPGESNFGPCSLWAGVDDVRACERCAETLTDEQLLRALAQSSEFLFAMSGHQYPGVCTTTVRPCRGPACRCADPCACSCFLGSTIELGVAPIVSVLEVRVDGAVVSPSLYTVLDGISLMRLDDESWPCCQDLRADPLTETNTMSVTVQYGRRPPGLGIRGAADLACELARACAGKECNANEKIATVSRRGTTMSFVTPNDLRNDSGEVKTGVRTADLFLAIPGHDRAWEATIHSPDVGPASYRVGL